jgi:F5/8 type C domain
MEQRAVGHESAQPLGAIVKQTLRNVLVFGAFAATCVSANGGCSSTPEGGPIGFGSTAGAATAGASTGTSGTFGSGGTSSTAGSPTGTSGSVTVLGGTFGNAGTFSSSGTATTAGASTGGVDAGGSGGATTAGASGAATGGAPASDFPAGCAAPTGTHSATALTRTCWGAKASDCAKTADNMNPPTQAIDASATTRFSTGTKMTASKLFTYDLDLGSAVMVNGVVVTSEAAKSDYAPSLEVGVSMDGTTFTPVACGPGAVVTDFAFTPVNARYVRFTQHGTADSWWSVFDLNVYASTGDTCAGGGTQMNTCTTPHTQ